MRIEELKQKMKSEYAKKVDEYFAQYEELKTSENLNINSIEMLLGTGITAAKEVIVSATEEMIKPETDTELDSAGKKKHVPAVEGG